MGNDCYPWGNFTNGMVVYDFDGTIVEHNYPRIGNPRPEIIATAHEFKKLGFGIAVQSCRSSKIIHPDTVLRTIFCADMVAFLDFIRFPYDFVDTTGEWGKLIGVLYIDDRGVGDDLKKINAIIEGIVHDRSRQ